MEVRVNADDWNGLEDASRVKIQEIIGANFNDVNVVPDTGMQKSEAYVEALTPQNFKLSNPLCTAACGVAEAAAVAACALVPGGQIAIAVCIAAAHEAGNFCRSKC